MKVAFVAHLCPQYRISTFELLGAHHDVDFYFYSVGGMSPLQWQRAASQVNFSIPYLHVFQVGQARIAPALISRLWFGKHDVIIKCMNGRFAVLLTYLIARLKRRPFILWSGIWTRLQSPVHRLFFPLTRYLYRHADALVVYGEHSKRYWVSEGVPPERIFLAAHALDNSAYADSVSADTQAALLQKLGVTAGQKVILYSGQLEEGKGLSYLLEAFAALRRDDAVLVLAGTGSQESRLRAAADEMGIAGQVRFAGDVPEAEAIQYYAVAWACVLSSITLPAGNETWGLSVNMAFNQGVPVIATDAVGAAAGGLAQHNVNGFVVPERNAAALADALRLLLDQPDVRARLGANARATIAQWDNNRMVLGFRQAIAHVTGAEAPD
ncbi:MAG: glycosyltransferase family 4 protein [Gammaproteobacteria bacterium]|nr:glycosyltransferase family 4 protein [Gammaproteobacteria bacterium]